TVVVTGGSCGIDHAFICVKAGVNAAIIYRSAKDVEIVAFKVAQDYGVTAKTLQ
ncbi:5476_t:CDS:1, partial [Acaulospora colombiana]